MHCTLSCSALTNDLSLAFEVLKAKNSSYAAIGTIFTSAGINLTHPQLLAVFTSNGDYYREDTTSVSYCFLKRETPFLRSWILPCSIKYRK